MIIVLLVTLFTCEYLAGHLEHGVYLVPHIVSGLDSLQDVFQNLVLFGEVNELEMYIREFVAHCPKTVHRNLE